MYVIRIKRERKESVLLVFAPVPEIAVSKCSVYGFLSFPQPEPMRRPCRRGPLDEHPVRLLLHAARTLRTISPLHSRNHPYLSPSAGSLYSYLTYKNG